MIKSQLNYEVKLKTYLIEKKLSRAYTIKDPIKFLRPIIKRVNFRKKKLFYAGVFYFHTNKWQFLTE